MGCLGTIKPCQMYFLSVSVCDFTGAAGEHITALRQSKPRDVFFGKACWISARRTKQQNNRCDAGPLNNNSKPPILRIVLLFKYHSLNVWRNVLNFHARVRSALWGLRLFAWLCEMVGQTHLLWMKLYLISLNTVG